MSTIGQFHTVAAVLALASGAIIFTRRKGTPLHRRVGWVYVGSMLAMNASALMIYRLFGGFGPFHAGAILSLAGLIPGVVYALRARRDRRAPDRQATIARHYYWMSWSYVGLCAAAVSEVATRMPRTRSGAAFGMAVAVATALVLLGGAWIIRRQRAAVLAAFAISGRPAGARQ